MWVHRWHINSYQRPAKVVTLFRERNIPSLLFLSFGQCAFCWYHVASTWTYKTADATKALWASELSLPASANWASFARTLLVEKGTRASPPFSFPLSWTTLRRTMC